VRLRPRYANVTATLALVVALGGGAYAASLPKDSVTSATIKNGQVKAKDLARTAVTGAAVKDGSLGAADLAPGTIPVLPPATDTSHLVKDTDPRLTDQRTPKTGSVSAATMAALPHASMRQPSPCQTFEDNSNDVVHFAGLTSGFDVTFDDLGDDLTVHTAGTYLVSANVNWVADATGPRQLQVRANSGDLVYDSRIATPTIATNQTASTVVHLDVGTILFLTAGQISGHSLALTQGFGPACASLSVAWLGP
jgi:hypothetical protein